MTAWTLQEAMSQGQGTERPFKCPDHDDTFASASVNVIKGVWYCYACHSSGGIDKKHVPSGDDLLSMLEPEKTPRIYPESYLEVFESVGYWQTRFPDWLCWYAQLGHDPFSGNDTFPVRTPEHRLAGVGLRMTNAAVEHAKEAGENPSRYKYPYGWSASAVLGGLDLTPRNNGLMVLTEGYADAVSLWQVGIPAICTYGAGLHYPQLELLYRLNLQHVLWGFDMDNAGEHAAARAHEQTKEVIKKADRIIWPQKDPADCLLIERREAVISSVGTDRYVDQWDKFVALTQRQHSHHLEMR